MEKNPGFLQDKYADLNKSREVTAAALRTKRRTKKEFPMVSSEDANLRIQNYLDQLSVIVNNPNTEKRTQSIEKLKSTLHQKYVIKSKEIPESYFDSIKLRHRQEGHGDIEIPLDYRKELAETLIADQEDSFDAWIDYLASKEAKYPDWLKYFAFRSILRLGRYDKGKKAFTERTGGAVSLFPDINREALAVVLGDLEKKFDDKNKEGLEFIGRHDIEQSTKDTYTKFLENKNFAKLYALAIEEFKPIPEELLKITDGKWVTYPRGTDGGALVKSISTHGTGWCLRGKGMADRYLMRDKNDLHVYYSLDKDGKSTVPRVVMVVNANNKIAEVRGVAKDEHLDHYIGDIVQTKLKEHPDGKSYEKKSVDMKLLTTIENKTKKKEPLSKDDLVFLYEIDSKIEGFGYQDDPRIKELQATRNKEEDMPIIFDCTPDQIAKSPEEVRPDTKAYIGKLFDGIFTKDIEHIFTSFFPEGKITKYMVEISGKTGKEYKNVLDKENITHASWADELLEKMPPSQTHEKCDLIPLTVKDLGFENGATTDEIYQRAEKFGLELCPPEVGPELRLSDRGTDRRMVIGMKQIADSAGASLVFHLYSFDDEMKLSARLAKPSRRWNAYDEFVFRVRKVLKS